MARPRNYCITDAHYADDLGLIVNTLTQAESLLHSLEQTAERIRLHVNADQTESLRFNQEGDISTLNGGSLKLVDKLTYLGSRVSSTESDINMRLVKPWIAIDKLSIIWKSDLTDKIKRDFSQAVVVPVLL